MDATKGIEVPTMGKYIQIRAELLGIIGLILVQTGGMIWWMSRTEERLENLEEDVAVVEEIHQTQVTILTEIAAIKQALSDSGCGIAGSDR